jgi:hypothetical protein
MRISILGLLDMSESSSHTNERYVVLDLVALEAGEVWQSAKGRDAREDRVCLLRCKLMLSIMSD